MAGKDNPMDEEWWEFRSVKIKSTGNKGLFLYGTLEEAMLWIERRNPRNSYGSFNDHTFCTLAGDRCSFRERRDNLRIRDYYDI